ncbi:MAG TPA: gephyrin-like molybdotransferase Glp [Thermoleophilia bacterium]|nr:gephyrin-like molybdotransferase Glp [Thermoleophilia bacterium]
MVTIEEARALVLAEASPLPSELRSLSEVLGGVLTRELVAPHDIPPFDNSAMDGYAVRAVDTVGAPDAPVTLAVVDTVAAGRVARAEVGPGESIKIMTGAPLPLGADAVVEVEATEPGDGTVVVLRELAPGENVRRAGEDVRRGTPVLAAGDIVGPAEVGLAAGLGFPFLEVHRRPRVAIVATGSELVEVSEQLAPGLIRNSNSYTMEAQCRQLGIDAERLGIAPDEYQATRSLLARGMTYDVLITSGGVSVGEFDFVKEVQDDLGVERRLWRVAMKPGKPLVFGVKDGCLVFGVPGNPVAAMISFELFIRPALLRLMGHRKVLRPVYQAVMHEDLVNRYGRVHVVRVRAWHEGGMWHASSTGPQGSGILKSMVNADGLVFVPADTGGIRAGEVVDMTLLREQAREA